VQQIKDVLERLLSRFWQSTALTGRGFGIVGYPDTQFRIGGQFDREPAPVVMFIANPNLISPGIGKEVLELSGNAENPSNEGHLDYN
jgi:hypothetical protein